MSAAERGTVIPCSFLIAARKAGDGGQGKLGVTQACIYLFLHQ